MEINKDKKQKDCMMVYQRIVPKPFLCCVIEENTDIEDEFEVTSKDTKRAKKVQQTIKGQVFTTEIVYEEKSEDGWAVREEAKRIYVLPLGTRLIWIEGEGYTATEDNFQTIDELQETINILK